MTIEALLQSIDARLAVLIGLTQGTPDAPVTGQPVVVPAGAQQIGTAAPGEAPKRGRGRPAKGETAPVVGVTTPAVVAEVDPFDQPAVVVQPAKKATKDDVRASLEAFRQRLKAGKIAQGVAEPEAQAFGTQRVLAWLNSTFNTTTLAGLKEDQFDKVIATAQTAQ